MFTSLCRFSPHLYRFPSQGVIASYLKRHPQVRDRYLTDKKIIDAVSGALAQKKLYRAGIEMITATTLQDLNSELKLPADALGTIQRNLADALKDGVPNKRNRPTPTPDDDMIVAACVYGVCVADPYNEDDVEF